MQRADRDRVPLKDRLTEHAKALLGFSFAKDWDTAKWGVLTTAFALRNEVAHGTARPTPEQAWAAISVTREAVLKLIELCEAAKSSASGAAGP